MLDVFKNYPPIIDEAKKAKFKPSFVLQLLIFIGIYAVVSILQSIPLTIYGVVYSVIAVMGNDVSTSNPAEVIEAVNKGLMLPMLFSTCIITIVAILYCRFLENRSLYSMGFTREKLFLDYGLGLVIGFVMFSVSVFISWTGGTLKYSGFTLGNGMVLLLAFFTGFVIQGMAEEVLLRGYLMISIASRNSIALAVFTNSILFSLMHISNSGITVLALVNLTLFGVFASLYVLKTNSIWGVCAIHTMWNFAQGNIFGIKVSGMDTIVSLFSFTPTNEGTWLNGGAFGLEGGIAVTIVLCISIVAVLFVKGREANSELALEDGVNA